MLRSLSDIFRRWVSLRNYPVGQSYNISHFCQSIHGTLDEDLRGVVDLCFLRLSSRYISAFPTSLRKRSVLRSCSTRDFLPSGSISCYYFLIISVTRTEILEPCNVFRSRTILALSVPTDTRVVFYMPDFFRFNLICLRNVFIILSSVIFFASFSSTAKPTTLHWNIIGENLVSVRKQKPKIIVDRPIYLGFCVLKLSKTKNCWKKTLNFNPLKPML